VHLQISLVQSFVLLFKNFEELVQIITLKRFGGAPHYNQLAPLSSTTCSTSRERDLAAINRGRYGVREQPDARTVLDDASQPRARPPLRPAVADVGRPLARPSTMSPGRCRACVPPPPRVPGRAGTPSSWSGRSLACPRNRSGRRGCRRP
jgi:hypothetical protein